MSATSTSTHRMPMASFLSFGNGSMRHLVVVGEYFTHFSNSVPT